MRTETTGTFIDGVLKLDTQPLADDTRVRVTFEPVDSDAPTPESSRAAWEEIKARLRERPIHAGGKVHPRGTT